MKKILLLSGKQGAGKTANATAIDTLCDSLGYRSMRMKFADIIYDLHDQCLPILQEAGLRPAGMSKDGELLQIIGTEYGRKCLGQDVWAKALKTRVDKSLAGDKNDSRLIIIDDARFENEFDIFADDAFKVRLECPAEVRRVRANYWRENANHPSETGLDDYAVKGKFNLRVNTEFASKEAVSHMIRMEWFNAK